MRMKKIKEGLGELADMAERDHEVQMARADLYKLAKYAIKLHDMLKGVSEAEGIDGWQQAKITKAADYISSVYHALDYDMKFANGGQMAAEMPVESKNYFESLQAKLKERELSRDEEREKERIVKGMKKNKSDFQNRYGDDAESVMYATATKRAKNESKKQVCSECGKPSWRTLDEEKQKGVDGKVCWKGYKRMGTKQKDGKTVDNCVKM